MQRDSDAGPDSDKAVTLAEPVRAPRKGPSTLGGAATLPRAFGADASEPRIVDPDDRTERSFEIGTRYDARRILGEGGMGEVRLCADSFIGREVAMKVIRAGGGTFPDAQRRFLREARVQGQLEHPAIVPVYDIGVLPTNETFFTMKRVVGRTLEEIIAGLGAADPAVSLRFPTRKLLSALGQVSLALAFAHSKGVVHRDLKPANIMLGDYGEVYVLDWGIAKIASSEEPIGDPKSAKPISADGTQAGELLGTPGYMSPEQARGEASRCDGRADVYALGAILYETLTLSPLHRSKKVTELLVSALRLDGAHPRELSPTLPEALDAICHRATRLDPKDRYESARDLHEALEGFLDGERDRERRKELADVHTARAESLLEGARGDGDAELRRTEVMRELGSALVLDPSHRRAQRALLEVLVHEPETIPPDAQRELDDVNIKDRAESALGAALTYLGWFLLVPFALWMGIREPRWIIALGLVDLSFVALMLWMWRTKNANARFMRIAIIGNFLIIAFSSLFFGPLILLPQAVTTLSATLMVSIRANRLTRLFITGLATSTLLAPVIAANLGWLPMPYTFERGLIVIHPFAVDFTPTPTIVFLFLTTAFSLVTPALLIGRGVEALIANEKRTVARAYRLRQLLPTIEPTPESKGQPAGGSHAFGPAKGAAR